eukprot:424579_1
MQVVLLSWLTNICNGLLYTYPNYSKDIEHTLGLSQSQIVIVGVASHLGIGIVQFPLGYLYRSSWLTEKGLKFVDRFVITITITLLIVSTLGIYLFARFGSPSNATTNFVALTILFILFGSGVGGSFGHSCWCNNYNFQKSKYKKTVIVTMSFTFGFGAFLFSLLYPYTFNKLSLADIFLIHFVLYASIGVFRVIILVRHPTITINPITSVQYTQTGDSHLNAHDDSAEDLKAPIKFQYVFKSVIAWLLFISTFFGIGIGGTFISMVADVVESIQGENDPTLTSRISMVFLGTQAMARLISAILVKYTLESLLLSFHLIEFIFCLYISISSLNVTSAYVISIATGWCFGGIWSLFPAVVSDYFPGGHHNFGPNLGLTIYAPAFGVLIVGIIETKIFEAQNGSNGCKSITDENNYCFKYVFIAFTAFSAFSSCLAMSLLYVMKIKSK